MTKAVNQDDYNGECNADEIFFIIPDLVATNV